MPPRFFLFASTFFALLLSFTPATVQAQEATSMEIDVVKTTRICELVDDAADLALLATALYQDAEMHRTELLHPSSEVRGAFKDVINSHEYEGGPVPDAVREAHAKLQGMDASPYAYHAKLLKLVKATERRLLKKQVSVPDSCAAMVAAHDQFRQTVIPPAEEDVRPYRAKLAALIMKIDARHNEASDDEDAPMMTH